MCGYSNPYLEVLEQRVREDPLGSARHIGDLFMSWCVSECVHACACACARACARVCARVRASVTSSAKNLKFYLDGAINVRNHARII